MPSFNFQANTPLVFAPNAVTVNLVFTGPSVSNSGATFYALDAAGVKIAQAFPSANASLQDSAAFRGTNPPVFTSTKLSFTWALKPGIVAAKYTVELYENGTAFAVKSVP
jgi:hypothetical protein